MVGLEYLVQLNIRLMKILSLSIICLSLVIFHLGYNRVPEMQQDINALRYKVMKLKSK
jgi:Ca2+/Na+ antiporter